MRRMYAEWEPQRCVVMSFPHVGTDWYDPSDPQSLHKALTPFIRIAQAIAYKEPVYILCDEVDAIKSLFCSTYNMIFWKLPSNDTWIRDFGPIGIEEDGQTKLLDFTFDGWGGKFDAELDNAVNRKLHATGLLAPLAMESIDFVLEGGSIESDGRGTILTTASCLCHPNRNGGLNKAQVEAKLHDYLGATRILWLEHGYLAGDDTDGHIDTLARFVSPDTIVYAACDDPDDEHYDALQAMKRELESFNTAEGKPYRLVPLPLPRAIYDDNGRRLPATYANFLITNDALVFPTYADQERDKQAEAIFKELFPTKEVIGVNCLKLIEQGGSLHCSTMQIAR